MADRWSMTIIRETHEVITYRRRKGGPVRAWCDGCVAEVLMLTPEQAAPLASSNTRALYRWVEAGLLHYAEAPAGALLVCLKSLMEIAAARGLLKAAEDAQPE